MKKGFVISVIIIISGIFTSVFGQQHTENKADQALRSSGRVNASTLGMEIDIPLGSYPGRGINVPVSLSYSSKLWRIDYMSSQPAVNNPDNCISVNYPKFGENSASGWTTSMAVPYVEYTGADNLYQNNGFPLGMDAADCTPNTPQQYYENAYVRKIIVHLPSGGTHELRMDDTVKTYPFYSNCVDNDPNTPCDTDDPSLPANWNGWYYSADGSNLKYYEDRTNNVYFLQMPDGSKYDFVNSLASLSSATIRKANKFSDRNGNYTTYNEPTTSYPNGYWTDTLGKIIAVPFGLSAPTSPTAAQYPQVYSMPGFGSGTITYKFHWKQLKGSTAAESALTDFNTSLKYMADRASSSPYQNPRSSGTFLFGSEFSSWVQDGSAGLFNPVLLSEIELPTGQKYKFTYDVYGRIERIYYPTGGEERFEYSLVPVMSHTGSGDINAQTNFGVTKRQVYQTAGTGTPYEWLYSAAYVTPNGYKVTITNPDGTKAERYLHRNTQSWGVGTFGYDTALAGMAYEERGYSSTNQLVSKKLTTWAVTSLTTSGGTETATAHWHPRVTQEESIIYDSGGNGVSATSTFEYEGDLSYRDAPVLMKKNSQYAFVVAGSSLPANPVRSSETTFLINDANITQTVRDAYKARNMIGLATASIVKDSAGTIVARSEMVYDESGTYPIISAGTHTNWQDPYTNYRGNPTTAKVWDSTKGAVTNTSAYIATHAQFDNFGNQRKAWDASNDANRYTETGYSSTYGYAFATSVTTVVPDPTNTHGSNTAFQTSATFDAQTGLPLTTTDANNLKTQIEYDSATLRPLNVKNFYQTNQVGATAETVYHDEPNNYWVKSRAQIDADKWAESITYLDGLGRAYKSEQIDSQGNIFVEKEFDEDGRVKRVTNPFRAGETKHWTTNVYDEASRIKEVVLPDTSKVTTGYGVSTTTGFIGVTKTITDQAGKKRKGISDALGRMIRVVEDPDSQNLATDYVFDTLGNLRKTIQGDQNRYFNYDSLGRLLFARQPEQDANTNFSATDSITGNTQWSVKYEYDDNGNITKTTDARGVYVQGTYDNLNRLKTRIYSDATPAVSFYYDGKYYDESDVLQAASGSVKGKTTGIKSSVSKTNYTSFDNLGRLSAHQQITDGRTFSTAYTYNLSGALIEETYPSGRVVRNVLNNDGELAAVQSKKNANSGFFNYADSFAYNSAGAVTKMQLGNGKWETAEYNNRLQLTKIGLGATDAQTDFLKLEYSYGTSSQNNGSMLEQKITVPAGGGSSGFTAVQTYAYDSLNRLQSAQETVSSSQTWKQTFSYDRYGNRRFDTANNNTTTLGSCTTAVCNPTVNTANNRFSSGQGYSYDATGNLTVDAEGKQFLYDAENHQKEVRNSQNQPIGLYSYDGDGKRVKKNSSTETVIFVYNAGGKLVAEYSTALAQTPQVSYLTADHLGSARVITDRNGAVTKRQDYAAFGDETLTSQRTSGLKYTTSSDELRKGYTGYEKDDESGLDFAQARYYNSTHGRFTSADPLTASANVKNPQTFNRYSYVLNSPYKFTDPLGLISSSTGACGRGCANSNGDSGGGLGIGLYSGSEVGQTIQIGFADSLRATNKYGGRLNKAERKALQKELSSLAPGTKVKKSGKIIFDIRKLSEAPGVKLVTGLMNSAYTTTIRVNHEGLLMAGPINSNGSVNVKALDLGETPSNTEVFWDPDAKPESTVRADNSPNAEILVETTKPVMTLGHELIHAYNFTRGDWGWSVPVPHTFSEGEKNYYENVETRAELRAIGLGYNRPGDITENDLRQQLGMSSVPTVTFRENWLNCGGIGSNCN